jgi:hypothetical protein
VRGAFGGRRPDSYTYSAVEAANSLEHTLGRRRLACPFAAVRISGTFRRALAPGFRRGDGG